MSRSTQIEFKKVVRSIIEHNSNATTYISLLVDILLICAPLIVPPMMPPGNETSEALMVGAQIMGLLGIAVFAALVYSEAIERLSCDAKYKPNHNLLNSRS